MASLTDVEIERILEDLGCESEDGMDFSDEEDVIPPEISKLQLSVEEEFGGNGSDISVIAGNSSTAKGGTKRCKPEKVNSSYRNY